MFEKYLEFDSDASIMGMYNPYVRGGVQVPQILLKPLDTTAFSADERKMLTFLRDAVWEPQADARESSFKAKVPEFFGGVRLYRIAAGGAAGQQNPLEMFIKKLAFMGSLTRQGLSPLVQVGAARYVVLTQAEMTHLGIGQNLGED